MYKIRKIRIVLLLVLSILILSGWGEKSVELLNDKPLIDLNKAIKEVPLGKQGNILTIKGYEESSKEVTIENQKENSAKDKSEVSQNKIEYKIIIQDTTIYYNGSQDIDIETLKNKINNDCNNMEIKISLIDKYAESHVYKEVLAILEQLHKENNLEYQEVIAYD